MVQVKAVKPFFYGSRFHEPIDKPFEVEERTADKLTKAGLVTRHIPLAADLAEPEAEVRTDPAPSQAARSVAPVQRKRG